MGPAAAAVVELGQPPEGGVEGPDPAGVERFADQVVPAVARGERPEWRDLVAMAEPLVSELLLAGNVILNITVPVAVATAMGQVEPEAAGRRAEGAALISAGIPGARRRAAEVGRLAQEMMAV